MPPGESEVTLAAHYVNPSVPPPAILASPAKPPSLTPPKQRISFSSSPGARKREYDKYGPNERKSSPSPNRKHQSKERGRSPGVKDNTAKKTLSRTS